MNDELFVHTDTVFAIVGEHPHAGERCHPVGTSPTSVSTTMLFGVPMYLVELIDCPHGEGRAFAEKRNLKFVSTTRSKS